MRSNYVCAGFETVAGILDRFIKSTEYKNNFTRKDINDFFSNTCNKFLHSYGQYFKDARKYEKYSKKENELFTKCRGFGFFDDSEFFVDSGGFQISVGILDKVKTDLLFNTFARYFPVYDFFSFTISSGVPSATIYPPSSPLSGPRSIT